MTNIRFEVETIIGRKITGLEHMRVRNLTLKGMVNPYDIVTKLELA